MKRFILLSLLLTTGLSSLALAGVQPARPNVLFIFADDQRADTIAALGNPVIRTPNLDRLCHNGLAFSRAYMQGGWHGATCMPSRAMLLSGQSLFHMDEQLLRDETWPEAFGRAGYATFVAGKWHNGSESLKKCFQNGRGIFLGGMSQNPLDDYVQDLEHGQLGPRRRVQEHLCMVAADEAIHFLRQPRTEPFFCYVAFDAPHDPHIVPPDFPIKYSPQSIPLPPNFKRRHPFDNGEMHVRDEKLLPWPRRPRAIRSMLADYYRYVSFVDLQVGRILDALNALPTATNTIIVYAADSGVARGSHGLIGKQNLYEYDSIRVPLILAGPGIPTGRQSPALCYLYDVLPTLGALCRVPAPPRSEGIDLQAVLHGSPEARRSLVFAYREVQRALVTQDWKLIDYPKAHRVQLFNLNDDPGEIHNLAYKVSYASTVARLTTQLKSELSASGDTDPQRGAPNSKRL